MRKKKEDMNTVKKRKWKYIGKKMDIVTHKPEDIFWQYLKRLGT